VNRKRYVVVVLGLVTVAVALVVWSRSGEPRFQGQPLTYWVDALWNSGANQEEAKSALKTVEVSKAVPFLLKKVRQSAIKQKNSAAWSRLPPTVKDYVPEPDLDFNLVHNKIPYALSLMGSPVIPRLQTALQDHNADVQNIALRALGMMGSTAEATLPGVISLLHHTNGDVRLSAVFAVQQIGGTRPEAIQALVGTLLDSNRGPNGTVWVRESAVSALGRLGPAAKAAVPAITGLLDAPDVYTRREVIRALWRIDHDTNLVDRAVHELETSRHGSQNYKSFLNVLAEMGPAARPAVPAILQSATNLAKVEVSRTIRPALAKIDPDALNALDQAGR
jgi:HEAT repeat protein